MAADLKEYKSQFLEYLEIEKGRGVKTVENYDRYLNRFLTFAKVRTPGQISEQMVREFRIHLKRALAKTSGRDLDLITSAELERLMSGPKGDDVSSLRDKAILELFFSTGLRVSELCNLNQDLDLTRDEFSVRGKGEKVRVVFLSPSAKKAVAEYLKKRGDMSEALFVSYGRGGKSKGKDLSRITPRSIERIVKQYAVKAGITRKVTPHVIRHSFATDLLQNGADLRSVQALLGHANIATTQVYTHVTDSHLRDVHKQFHGKRRS
ncbi:MAG: putative Tyrosine recombinase xerD [Parcubacteria group bacterium Athens0416_74]|nr:MAG: putative Tyrosine recombinase xerD [Parcubacteria group bacterium Athens0416_74]